MLWGCGAQGCGAHLVFAVLALGGEAGGLNESREVDLVNEARALFRLSCAGSKAKKDTLAVVFVRDPQIREVRVTHRHHVSYSIAAAGEMTFSRTPQHPMVRLKLQPGRGEGMRTRTRQACRASKSCLTAPRTPRTPCPYHLSQKNPPDTRPVSLPASDLSSHHPRGGVRTVRLSSLPALYRPRATK